jgi:hypothetical protein
LNKNRLIVLFVLILLAVVVRVYKLNTYDITFDEAAAWSTAHNHSYIQILAGNYTDVGDLPLPYILIKFVDPLIKDPLSARLVVVFFGVLSLVPIFCLSEKMGSLKSATFTTFVFIFLSSHVYYSREFRSYIIGLFFQMLMLFFFYLFYIKKERSERNLSLFVVSSLLALFSSFSTVFILISMVIFTFFQAVKKKTRKQDILLLIYCFVPFLLWFLMYMLAPESRVARLNYVAYFERTNFSQILKTVHDVFFFIPEIAGNYSNVNFFQVIFMFINLVIFLFGIKKFWKSKVYSFLLFSLFFSFAAQLLFSLLKFNVISVRLLLPLLSIFMIVNSQFYYQFIEQRKFKKIIEKILLLSYISALLLFTYSIYGIHHYSIKAIKEGIISGQCDALVFSHEIGRHALYFETNSNEKSIKKILVNYNLPDSFSKLLDDVGDLPPTVKYLCYFGYYDKYYFELKKYLKLDDDVTLYQDDENFFLKRVNFKQTQ